MKKMIRFYSIFLLIGVLISLMGHPIISDGKVNGKTVVIIMVANLLVFQVMGYRREA